MAKKIKDPTTPKVVVKKKSGVGGKIVALLVGFVLGAGAVVGGVVGAGYWAVTRPIKKVDDTVSKFVPELDLSKYLSEEYYNDTVLNLLGGVGSAISDISSGNGSFASLAKISPTVEDAMEKLAKKLIEMGSTLPEENIVNGLLDTPFNQLGTFLSDTLLNSVQVGQLLLNTKAFSYETLKDDALMMTLLYGVEGTDYTLDDENQKILPVAGGKAFLSIGSIRNDGITETLGVIPVDSLLSVGEGDGIMRALAYGSEAHYSYTDKKDADGKPVLDENGDPVRVVTMKPLVYVRQAANEYYLDGEKLDCTEKLAEGKTDEYVLTFSDGTTQYLKKQADQDGLFDVYTAADGKQVTYPKTTLSVLMDNPQSILEQVELASVLEIKDDANPILLTIAYGIENKDYEFDENGKITMIAGKSPKTLADLTGDKLDSLVSELPLDSIMTVKLDDGMMTALAYGPESHWSKDDDGKVTMNPIVYNIDADGTVYNVDGVAIKDASATPNNGVYTVVIGEKTTYAKSNTQGSYYVYPTADCESGNELTYAKTTVGDLQSDPSALLDNVLIKDVMEVEYGKTNSILIALAYGVEGEDYDVSEGVIVPREGHPPKTIGSLTGGELNDVIDTLPLDAILTIDLTDKMMTSLAYGSQSHWEPGSDGKAHMLPVEYTLRSNDGTSLFYDKDGNEVCAAGEAVDGVYTITVGEEVKYVKATENVYYQYGDKECAGEPETYEKRTVGDLQKDPQSLINDIKLADVLDLESPDDPDADKLMIALAYGNRNQHYTTDGKGNVTWLTDDEGNAYKARTIFDLRDKSGDLFKEIYIGDALGVNADSHPVLIAIAYGEEHIDFEFDGKAVIPSEGKTPRTLRDLSGENSKDIINGVTLEAALSINARSDKLMRALAYGQLDTHYTIDPEDDTKVIMSHAFYTVKEEDGVAYFYDKNNAKVIAVSEAVSDKTGYDHKIEIDGKEPQYLSKTEDRYYVYREVTTDEGVKMEAVPFTKATIGELSANGSGLINNVTLADALGVEETDTGLKKSLAYDKDGRAYTIGELSEDPNAIINRITIEDALNVSADTEDKLLLALAYGQKGVHYTMQEKTDEATNATTVEAVMLQEFYTLKGETGKEAFVDRYGNEMAKLAAATSATAPYTYKITLADDVVRLLKQDKNETDRFYVFTESGDEVAFEKPTIGTLSSEGSGLIHSITLADALDVDETDTGLKKALAYSKDGRAYTIGELSEDPNAIVYSIELDTVMQPNQNNALTMYLLYGKDHLHYDWVETTDATTGETTGYALMLEKVMAVHELLDDDGNATGKYCLHNEYGEEVTDDEGLQKIDADTVVNGVTVNKDVTDWVTKDGSVEQAVTYFAFVRHGTLHRLILPDDENLLPLTKTIRLKGKNTVLGYEGNVYYVQYYNTETGSWENEVYEKNTIGALAEEDTLLIHLTDRLTLKEVLDVDLDGNIFLEPIADTTIGELPNAITQLKIVEVFEDSVYLKADLKALVEAGETTYYTRYEGTDYSYTISGNETDGYYYTDKNGVTVNDGDYIDNMGCKVDKADRILTGTWELLLTNPVTKPEEYTINQIGDLVGNMTTNVQTSSLNKLYENKIITLDNTSLLTTDIKYEISVSVSNFPVSITIPIERFTYADGTPKQTFGELTIKEIIRYITAVVTLK